MDLGKKTSSFVLEDLVLRKSFLLVGVGDCCPIFKKGLHNDYASHRGIILLSSFSTGYATHMKGLLVGHMLGFELVVNVLTTEFLTWYVGDSACTISLTRFRNRLANEISACGICTHLQSAMCYSRLALTLCGDGLELTSGFK